MNREGGVRLGAPFLLGWMHGRFEPKCMYRLLFARVQLHVFRKSLICIRPLGRLECFAVALLGVRTRRCLVTNLIYYDHLGSQTLSAPYSVPYN